MTKRLKVYFGCSIMGEQGGQEEKEQILEVIKNLGHKVLSETFVSKNPNVGKGKKLKSDEIYHRDINWIHDADLMVADVSRVSLGVGFEMGWVLGQNKKVVALCKKDKYSTLSNMIKGCRYPGFTISAWKNQNELQSILKEQLGEVDV